MAQNTHTEVDKKFTPHKAEKHTPLYLVLIS